MKYNFIYDKDFNDKCTLELSGTEARVVLATALGGHNALFYGYKPERLVKAVKLLLNNIHMEEPSSDISIEKMYGGGAKLQSGVVTFADKGLLLMNDIDTFKQSVVQMLRVPIQTKDITLSRAGNLVTYPCDFQLIATSSVCSDKNLCNTQSSKETWNKISSIAKACDIVYWCTEDSIKSIHSLSEITNNCNCAKNYNLRNHRDIDISKLKFTDFALSEIREINPSSSNLRLAKTLSVMNEHMKIWAKDVNEALLYHFEFPFSK